MNGMDLELARLDRLLHREALRLRVRYELSADELRGLYISDEQVDRLLDERAVATEPQAAPTIAQLTTEANDLDRALEDDGSPLRALARRVGLGAFERDLLLLAVAPELDLKYESIIGYLNNDITRKWPTLDLGLRLFAADQERDSLRALGERESRLFACGLLEPVPSDRKLATLARAFAASPVLQPHLAGRPCRISAPPRVVEVVVAGADAEDASTGGSLAAVWDGEGRAPVLVLQGRYGSGRRAAALDLARRHGRTLLVVDVAALARLEHDRDTVVQRLVAASTLYPCAVYGKGWGPVAHDGWVRECVARLVASSRVMLEATEDDGGTTLRGLVPLVVTFDTPSAAEREALWLGELERRRLTAAGGAVTAVAHRFALTPGQIRDAVSMAAVKRRMGAHDGSDVRFATLLETTKAQLDRELGKLAVKVPCTMGWEDLVLPPSTLERIKEVAAAIRCRERVHHEWGFARRSGGQLGLTAMFAGSSGTGKTMSAGVIASEVGLDLYRIDLAGVVSKYIGETEKNLDRIFDAARHAGAIVFFDEADALFGKRSEVKDAHDRHANIEVAYLLQKIEVHPGVVILATNLARNIDTAFSRRLHYVVEFPRPGPSHRERLWRGMFPPQAPLEDDVDFAFLAEQFDCTGGDIRTVVLDAAFLAAEQERAVSMTDLIRAMSRQLRKEGRLPSAGMFKQYYAEVARAG